MRRFSLPLCLALAATACLATPAHAETVVRKDRLGDVVATNGAASAYWKAPDNRSADIVRTTTVHRDEDVIVRVRLHRLRRQDLSVRAHLRTPEREFMVFDQRISAAAPSGPGRSLYLRRGGRTIACPGLSSRLAPRRNLVVLTIPRACLRTPTWVRTGVVALSWDARAETLYFDHSHRAGGFGRKVAVGRKVHPG